MIARHRPVTRRQWTAGAVAGTTVAAAALLTAAGPSSPAAQPGPPSATAPTARPADLLARPGGAVSPYLDARLRGYKAADEALRDMAGYYAPPDNARSVWTVGPVFPWARDRYAAAEVIANGWPLQPLHSTTWSWAGPHALQLGGDSSPDWRADGFWDRLSLHLAWYAQGDVTDVATWTPGDRDLVYRASATDRQKCDDLARLVAADTGRPVRVVEQIRMRPCLVFGGELTGLGLPVGPPTPDVVGGQVHAIVLTLRPLTRADLARWATVSPRSFAWEPGDLGSRAWRSETWAGAGRYLQLPIRDAAGGPDGAIRPALTSTNLLVDDVLRGPRPPMTADQTRQLLANLHLQVGGDWRIEDRPTTMFDLRADPPASVRP